MSDKPRDLILERVNRPSQVVADLIEGQNANWRLSNRMLEPIVGRLDRIDSNIQRLEKAINTLASEQALLGTRVEDAFSRAFRLDEIEDNHDPRTAAIGPLTVRFAKEHPTLWPNGSARHWRINRQEVDRADPQRIGQRAWAKSDCSRPSTPHAHCGG